MERAQLMFGCYRRGDANDPDTYVAAVSMVLSRYSAEVVKTVTDPFSGLPSRKSESGWTGLPDVADVKQACEDEAARAERYQQLGARKPVPRIEGPKLPGRRGNVFVPVGVPQYPAMVERCKTADPADWRTDSFNGKTGIWVPYPWLIDAPRAARTSFTTFTDAQLRELYPQPKAMVKDEEEGVPF
jgi:hypothetical protein